MFVTMLALAAAAQPCRSYDSQLPRPLAGWLRSGQGLDTGHAVTLPAPRGRLETRVVIRKPGQIGIAIDRDGWVELYPGSAGKPLAMAATARGPRCSTIRKIIAYRVRPGTYRVAVNRLKGGRAKLMLVHN
jgi:hypothetical protein